MGYTKVRCKEPIADEDIGRDGNYGGDDTGGLSEMRLLVAMTPVLHLVAMTSVLHPTMLALVYASTP